MIWEFFKFFWFVYVPLVFMAIVLPVAVIVYLVCSIRALCDVRGKRP